MSLSRMFVYDRDQESKTLKEKLEIKKYSNIRVLKYSNIIYSNNKRIKTWALTPRFNMKGCNKRVLAC